jgi:hypothetical protein
MRCSTKYTIARGSSKLIELEWKKCEGGHLHYISRIDSGLINGKACAEKKRHRAFMIEA